MDNEKMKALDQVLAQIEKHYGKGAIMKLGASAGNVDIEVIPTGCLSLDIALGIGGLPRGRIIEIYGPESSGKTTVALHAIAQIQKMGGIAAFVDAEHALDPTYASKLGVDLDNLYVSQPDTGEQALDICDSLVRSGAVDLIVIDSVAALTPKAEIEGEMGESHVGLQARLMSQALRKLTGIINKSNTCVIFINQLREKVGIMFGNPETTPGGKALKFYASVRIDVRKADALKDSDGIMGNLSGLFSTVNTKVGEIASDVGATPQAWNGGIFNMLHTLSDTVIVPIAAAILAIIMCYELIDMIVEKNNMHDLDTSMFFRWIFKSAFAILIVTNTWNIVMGVFDATQAVVNQSAGVIIGETSIDFDTLIPDLEAQLEAMDIGPLLGLWFQTLVVGLTMNILSICIFLVTYGRMIEIYAVTALGPIPLATLGNAEWRGVGQNYLKSLLALGFQAFLIMVVVGIYAVLIQQIGQAADISGAIWGCMGYTVLLCFCLFKTGSISKAVFTAH